MNVHTPGCSWRIKTTIYKGCYSKAYSLIRMIYNRLIYIWDRAVVFLKKSPCCKAVTHWFYTGLYLSMKKIITPAVSSVHGMVLLTAKAVMRCIRVIEKAKTTFKKKHWKAHKEANKIYNISIKGHSTWEYIPFVVPQLYTFAWTSVYIGLCLYK